MASEDQRALAERCLRGAEDDSMTFPEIVGALIAGGFEGYAVDFRARAATYYPAAGGAYVFAIPAPDAPIAVAYDVEGVRAAIREAQALVPGYSYRGFCAKTARAGCAGYLVSFSGRRAVYFGRSGEMHVEHFPD